MKNVCIFTNTLLKGGAEKQSILLARALEGTYNIWLVVYDGDKIKVSYISMIKDNHIKLVLLNGSHFKKCLYFYKFCKRENINIIFSYLLKTNFIGGFLGRLAGVDHTIGGIRNSVLDKEKIFKQRLLQNCINKFTVYNNHRGAENLARLGFNKEKSIVIPNCFELEAPMIRREKKSNVQILSVGRFVEAKDYLTAIKSVSSLRRRYGHFIYTIIGYGKLESQLLKWIEQYDAADFINVIVDPAELSKYYLDADIYLMTSIFEGLSNTVLEAMSYSLPLVVTNVGDNDKLVRRGNNGYLCEPKNTNQISESLFDLCISHSKRNSFGGRSYSILRDNFSSEKFKGKYMDFIKSLEK